MRKTWQFADIAGAVPVDGWAAPAGLPDDVGLDGNGSGGRAPEAGGVAGRVAAASAALVANRVAGAATTAITTIALRTIRLPPSLIESPGTVCHPPLCAACAAPESWL